MMKLAVITYVGHVGEIATWLVRGYIQPQGKFINASWVKVWLPVFHVFINFVPCN